MEYAADGRPDARSYRVDFGKIGRALPEFQPQWDARRGVVQLADAYEVAGLTLEDFEGPRFHRGATLKELLATGRLDDTLRWVRS